MTLLELAVVAAILAILAALTAAGVTGQGTSSRGAAKSNDRAEMQKAVDSYQGNHPNSEYPVKGGFLASFGGTSPGSTLPGAGNLGILFSSSFTTPESNTKKLVPDFIQRLPKHALDCAREGSVVASISQGTIDPDADCATASLGAVPVWQLDEKGAVVVNLAFSGY